MRTSTTKSPANAAAAAGWFQVASRSIPGRTAATGSADSFSVTANWPGVRERPRGRRSVGEDLPQGGGEGVRVAGHAVFTAEKTTVAAGERYRRRPEPFGHGHRRATGHLPARVGSDGDDDPGGCSAEGVEVMPVVGARDDVLPDERVVAGAVVVGGQPEHSRTGSGPRS